MIKSVRKRKGPLVLSYALVIQMLYFSQFFTHFFGGVHRICSGSKVHTVCSLLVSCVADNRNLEGIKLHFLEWKTHSFVLNLVPQNTENRKIFWGSMPPEPPRSTGLTPPCWYSQVLYSNLLATSIIITETPDYCLLQAPVVQRIV